MTMHPNSKKTMQKERDEEKARKWRLWRGTASDEDKEWWEKEKRKYVAVDDSKRGGYLRENKPRKSLLSKQSVRQDSKQRNPSGGVWDGGNETQKTKDRLLQQFKKKR